MGIDRLDEGDAPPISRGSGDQPSAEPFSEPHDGCGLSLEENADREAYFAHYRALVEAEYRDADLPTSLQASADHEKNLLHADADPLRSLGPAFETHPAEHQAAMARLDGAGVEVDLRHGAMSYSPSAMAGQPGRLILDPEASYGAVLHEMSHFSDDEAAGFPGLRHWLEDPAVTADGNRELIKPKLTMLILLVRLE